jgi:Phage integrase family
LSPHAVPALWSGGSVVERVFYQCLSKAGLRHVRIHDLRHTSASLLIQQGESLAYIRDQLGHHSIQAPWISTGIWCQGGISEPSSGWTMRRNATWMPA